MWQEVVKNRQTWTWPEYIESIRSGGEAGRRFWRQQHSGRIVGRWADRLGAERTYVVTLPPPKAPGDVLWDRFAEVCGIRPMSWREAPRANESLGAASTLVVRELNLLTKDLPLTGYKRRVKAVAKHLMPAHRGAGGRRSASRCPTGCGRRPTASAAQLAAQRRARGRGPRRPHARSTSRASTRARRRRPPSGTPRSRPSWPRCGR